MAECQADDDRNKQPNVVRHHDEHDEVAPGDRERIHQRNDEVCGIKNLIQKTTAGRVGSGIFPSFLLPVGDILLSIRDN
eukprot:CAMPEP_0175857690 /NCGR_PEP_ID=MMETSP0107_2-20121207/29232_1 /TAXON_ID=195067 ORGANISM="Goniomonas pacifica, Strain CCMP1869" /NCGR_SAMPLE_ID=MMETSP0107_2 /ASSEMBLY_ACC=CAM_ASM_000203 /LENGTH=78 /DNA_ID=CAMNT_0017174011 /DNA_START=187 /DNA_END=423 /DNA_ORIENTATION=-